MKRDMDLCRAILFAIEEEYVDTGLCNLEIPEYTTEQVAYHCQLLHDAGLISSYNVKYADNQIFFFSVGALTWEGHDFLDQIRQDTVWNKTKDVITKKGLPMIFDVVKQISSTIITAMTEAAIKSILE